MRKKLEGNGLWESSRMMLPEHIRALNHQRRELQKRQRVQLDDQEMEIIGNRLTASLQGRTEVTVKLFDEWEQLEVKGIVERIDIHTQRFMVDGEWFKLGDIEGIG